MASLVPQAPLALKNRQLHVSQLQQRKEGERRHVRTVETNWQVPPKTVARVGYNKMRLQTTWRKRRKR
jgi:hypothetical protein